MTAVANPPSFANLNRPAWGINGGQTLNAMNPDDMRGMFVPRKTISRSSSSSSIASSSSASSTSTAITAPQANGITMQNTADPNTWTNTVAVTPRKRPQSKGHWSAGKSEGQSEREFGRVPTGRPNGMNGASSMHQPNSILPSQQMMAPNGAQSRSGIAEQFLAGAQPVLYLLPLNGSFERKTISVPFYPETLRIGRQTNAKTVPTSLNGYFDSKVLSRQHAEIWADRNGKIWIRDIKSSNGTFVNGNRLSQENRESEAHELQPQDHLELGIDIVSEDQKTVVHHKVAAKVEHAGFMSPSNSILDMNFVDLDPASSGLMPLGGTPFRGRAGSQASANARAAAAAGGAAGAMANGGMAHQRQYWLNPVTTEHIVKRLHNEMRSARLQSHDLHRTGQFIYALLSKDDIKNPDEPEASDPSKAQMTNGSGGLSFRSDGGKTRFSDPPAPPPSQPLPEKPDNAARPHPSDAPSLKRGTTERPKSQPPNTSTSPVRTDNFSQIIELTEALNNAKKEIDNHSARVKELEEMFQKEREARLYAEDMVQKMEESTNIKLNGSAAEPRLLNGHLECSESSEPLADSEQSEQSEDSGDSEHLDLANAFDPPTEKPATPEPEMTSNVAEESIDEPRSVLIGDSAAVFQARIDSIMTEMGLLREQLDIFRQRAETAEAERDADRKTLAELVLQIRKRDEEEEKRAVERKSRSLSKGRTHSTALSQNKGVEQKPVSVSNEVAVTSADLDSPSEDPAEAPTLSRANTITPSMVDPGKATQDQVMIQSLPYASMIGVVILGMGLMTYLNGWQAQPHLDG